MVQCMGWLSRGTALEVILWTSAHRGKVIPSSTVAAHHTRLVRRAVPSTVSLIRTAKSTRSRATLLERRVLTLIVAMTPGSISMVTRTPSRETAAAAAWARAEMHLLLRLLGFDDFCVGHHRCLRNTPPQGHTLSPAQRSMGRRTRQMIPAPLASLMPLSSTSSLVQDEILARRQRAAITYDNHHRVQASLPELEAGDYVYVKPPPHRKGHAWSYGQITRLVEPRSCIIRTSSGEVRRNRAQVRMAAPPPPPVTVSTPAITSTSATPVSSQSALPAPAPQFPSAKSATSQFPLATSASSNPAVQPTVSSRCDPPREAQTPQSSLQSSVCASGDSSQKSLSQMAPYKTRSGRVVKSPKVFDPSDNV